MAHCEGKIKSHYQNMPVTSPLRPMVPRKEEKIIMKKD